VSSVLWVEMVLVTGGTGFIGRHLVDNLVKDNEGVYILTRRENSYIPESEKVVKIKGDITDLHDLPGDITRDIKLIFHCAGVIKDTKRMAEVNIHGTERVADFAIRHDIPLIHLSSVGVAGGLNRRLIDEDSPCMPANLYEKTKLEAEEIVKRFSKEGLKVCILRPTIVFGDGKDPADDSFFHLVSAIAKGNYFHIGDGRGVYNIVHVKEVVRAMRILAETDAFYGQTFFINTPITFQNFAKVVYLETHGEEPHFISIPAFMVYLLALSFSFLSLITRKRMPFGLSRYKAMTNKKTIEGKRILSLTPYRPEKGVEEYIREMVGLYKERGFLI